MKKLLLLIVLVLVAIGLAINRDRGTQPSPDYWVEKEWKHYQKDGKEDTEVFIEVKTGVDVKKLAAELEPQYKGKVSVLNFKQDGVYIAHLQLKADGKWFPTGFYWEKK